MGIFNQKFIFLFNVIIQENWNFIDLNSEVFLEKRSGSGFGYIQLN